MEDGRRPFAVGGIGLVEALASGWNEVINERVVSVEDLAGVLSGRCSRRAIAADRICLSDPRRGRMGVGTSDDRGLAMARPTRMNSFATDAPERVRRPCAVTSVLWWSFIMAPLSTTSRLWKRIPMPEVTRSSALFNGTANERPRSSKRLTSWTSRFELSANLFVAVD